MAIRLVDQYPNRVGTPDTDYPHGVPRNRSAPGAVDGTPFEQSWFRDQEGFFQGLLETAGVTPNGSPDTVEQSDYFDALVQAMHGVTEIDVGGVGDVTLGIYPSRVAALRLTGVLGADVDLIVPNTERLYWVIDETTGSFDVTIRTSAGTGVIINAPDTIVRSNGSDVVYTIGASTESAYGTIKTATQAQTDDGTDDATAVTPKKLRWGFDASLTANGYIAFPSWLGGLIIQWGKADEGDSALPIAFPTAGLVPLLCGDAQRIDDGQNPYGDLSAKFLDNANIRIYTGGPALDATDIFYVVIGH